MDNITLHDLRRRQLNSSVEQIMKDEWSLDEWNMRVYRIRCHDEKEMDFYKASHITHDGNDRRSIDDMLDRARVFLEYNLYTDEEWKTIILPIVNKEIKKEESFVRYMTGYVVRKKSLGICDLPEDVKQSDIGCITPDLFISKGTEAIVEYDYAAAYHGRDFQNISLCLMNKEGKIVGSASWFDHDSWEIVDTEHIEENISKMRDYLKGSEIPLHLSSEMITTLY